MNMTSSRVLSMECSVSVLECPHIPSATEQMWQNQNWLWKFSTFQIHKHFQSTASELIPRTNKYSRFKLSGLNSDFQLAGEGRAELQELSFWKLDPKLGDFELKVYWRCPHPPTHPLRFSWRWCNKQHARKHEGDGLSVQRMYWFYSESFSLSFHSHPVGRRLSFCFGKKLKILF